MKGRIIKWEGDPPVEPDAYVNPEAHPKCLEVVEVAENQSAKIVYKREDKANGTD